MTDHFDPYHVWLGIAPEEQPANHYRLLGLRLFEANTEVIATAADKQMVHLRTFQSGKRGPLSQQLLNEVSAARVCLLNTDRKAAYDQQLRQTLAAAAPAPAAPAPVAATAAPVPATPAAAPVAPAAALAAAQGKRQSSVGLIAAVGGIAVLLVMAGVLWQLLTGSKQVDKQSTDAPAAQAAATPPVKAAAVPLEPEVLKLEPAAHPNPAAATKSEPAAATPGPEAVARAKPPARATPKVAAAPPAKPNRPAPAKPQPAPPKEPAKLPPPSPEEVEKALVLVREIHKDDFAQAKTPAENQALARKLLEEGQRTSGDAVGRYALLYAAHRAGVLSGEVPAAFEPIEEMARLYAIAPLDMKALAIVEMLKGVRTPPQQKALVQQALGLMERTAEQSKPDLVQKLAGQVAVTAHRAHDGELTKSLTAVNKRIKERASTVAKYQEAQGTLKATPDDTAAHLAVGRYLCFIMGDWDRGLPQLAKGGDAVFSPIAALECPPPPPKGPEPPKNAEPPQGAEPQVQLADAWWVLTQQKHTFEREQILLHALECYELARPGLSAGLLRDKVEKRVAEISAEIDPKTVRGSGHRPPAAIAPFGESLAKIHLQRWGQYLRLPQQRTNSLGMRLALIPPGEFDMGATPDEVAWALDDARRKNISDPGYAERLATAAPRHRVKITRPFYMALFTVTQGEYTTVMSVNPSNFTSKQMDASAFQPRPDPQQLDERRTDLRKVSGKDTGRHPVEMVNWDEAQEFCRKLSALPAERTARRSYRLPTEAEWEYACRAGTTTRWSCGDSEAVLKDNAWFRDNAGGATHPAGQKRPNAWGLCDMHGNVYQWCSDWFAADYFAQSPAADPSGPNDGSARIQRGGGWGGIASMCYSSYRGRLGPAQRNRFSGFRVVLEIPPADAGGK